MAAAVHQGLDLLAHDYAGLIAEFQARWGKGEYHAGAVFRQVFRQGRLDLDDLPVLDANPGLRKALGRELRFSLPPISGRQGDGKTYKFLLKLRDGLECESVVIPMRHYKTLCISSQIGCKMACAFCETAQMGYMRNLSVSEILAQVMTARFVLGEPIANVVFMGMGEPMDNLHNVIQAVRILSEQRGLCIPKSAVTISTVGHLSGIRELAALARADCSVGGFSRIRLAVSLNAPDDAIRSRIMPVNRLAPMAELKQALQEFPLRHRDDVLFVEYVLIPGVNNGPEHALQVAGYLADLKACVNLIPYNPRRDSPFRRPTGSEIGSFFHALVDAGQYCRVRGIKGQEAMAACGQLGNREMRHLRSRAA